ncbi:aldo/keto reductase [Pedosphaera parvula]|uniref:Aldo/keto reductase n=1 Tax=Pedosphaera parvula (strain Ellin514) TaxID=320771 RepID=B9XSC8_PEDPL|nr:aldo/keto reductase [Pedosphaera parvula]EEF57261.1 aldo/keto reductase [Pedosphaera parvula Ellin514]
MKFRRIGQTEIDCSIIGLGTGRLASVSGGVSRTAAVNLFGVAEDLGINLIDTADSYAQGECEKIIGQALQGKRSQFIITTKAGYSFSSVAGGLRLLKPLAKKVLKMFKGGRSLAGSVRTNVSRQDFTAAYIQRAVDSSLQRLQTDYIDIFLLHTPPLQVMSDAQLFDLLRQLKQQGKIRHFGVSSNDPVVLGKAASLAGLSVVQTPVNPLQMGSEGALKKLAASKVGIVANQVFLSGKLVGSQAPNEDEARQVSASKDRLEILAKQKGISLNHLLIQYALMQPGLVSVLSGTTKQEHLKQNVADALSEVSYSAEELNLIQASAPLPQI